MNDRFKFRAKRIDNNHWYYGCYLFLKNPPQYDWSGQKKESKGDIHFIFDENDINYAIDPQTLEQCTGSKDKNGKLIFEGDIVQDCDKESWGLFEIVYDEFLCGFYFQNKYGNIFDLGHPIHKNCEVIGNIYETPELLKGGEK